MTDAAAPAPPEDLRRAKAAARTAARRLRAGLDPAGAGERLAACFAAAFPTLPAGTVVAGYWPLGDEIDVRPLLHHLARTGGRPVLPVMQGPGLPLRFRAWAPGQALRPGPFGVQEPGPEAPELVPSLVLVPLLAFDRTGMRLGYGAGFYDRTLALLRAGGPVTAVGIGHAAQEVPAVPHDGLDQPLDWVVTDRDAIRIGKD